MSQWIYNDVELEIEMGDVEFQEKYERALDKMGKTEKELQKVGSLSQITKGYCEMFYRFFDDLFGKGTGDKLFKGKYNIEQVEDAYEAFLTYCKEEVDRINKKRLAAVKKYRVTRR